jgi:hypothetical protein
VKWLWAMAAWYDNLQMTLTGLVSPPAASQLMPSSTYMTGSSRIEPEAARAMHTAWQQYSSATLQQRLSISRNLQLEGDIVATATYTLNSQSQTLIELPPEFDAVQMVMVTSSGGTPGPFPNIPSDEVQTLHALQSFG